jgi:hypothetical protein
MSTPMVTEYDAATDITISREMTAEEIAEYEATIAANPVVLHPE